MKFKGAAVVQAITEHSPGTIIELNKHGMLVATGCGVLRIAELQRPGGKMLPALQFVQGFSPLIGAVLVSEPMSQLLVR